MNLRKRLASFINQLKGGGSSQQDEPSSESSCVSLDEAAHPRKKSPIEELEATAADYNIQLVYKGGQTEGKITYKSPNSRHLPTSASLLRSELLIYAKEVLRSSRLRQIILTSQLKNENKPVAGLCLAHEGKFYLSVDYSLNNAVTRRNFHHELFHCIDFYDDLNRYHDPGWAALNETGFRYSEEKSAKGRSGLVNRLGFISQYAMSQVREDKAELYSHMIVHYREVANLAKTDSILHNKGKYMQTLLQRFSPHFNEYFWSERSRMSEPMDLFEDNSKLFIPSIATFQIWGEHIANSEHEMWFIGRIIDNRISPRAFYSKQELIDCLNRLEIADFSEFKTLRIGPKIQVQARVRRTVLVDLGL